MPPALEGTSNDWKTCVASLGMAGRSLKLSPSRFGGKAFGFAKIHRTDFSEERKFYVGYTGKERPAFSLS